MEQQVHNRLRDDAAQGGQPLRCRYRRIELHELELFNQLNREVFKHTAFTLPLHVIRRRNNELFSADPMMFGIVEASKDGHYTPVGMSHIIPLNDLGASLYVRNGGLKDSEISARYAAKQGEWSDSLVLFSMGILKSSRDLLKDRHLLLPAVFADHLVDLISEMCSLHPDRSHVRVYAQTEKPNGGIGRLLARLGFEETSIIGGDGYPLWELRLALPERSRTQGVRPTLSAVVGAWREMLPYRWVRGR
ncbi:hypothetical protein AB0H86_03545 [Streptomyces sp. NPDC050997]|uniref:hypothetical protein n=1 Tax=Streptomyces sp. NPDC050997 TaxID=3155519 RepID=UPI00342EB485